MMITPKPNSFKISGGNITLGKNTGLSTEIPSLAESLNGFVEKFAGYRFPEGSFIKFYKPSDFEGNEAYRINISDNGIVLTAYDDKGLFYAVQTLKQLLISGFKDGEISVPKCVINDKPRFQHRCFMLDCARHFFSVEQVKKMIEICALLKMSTFHWHIAEDQGWRFESKKFPKLTELGSWRAETKGDGKPVSGFYTQEEMRDVVAFAKERFIDIIPEIDLPGHATALLYAYPELACNGQTVDGVATRFGVMPNLVCAGKESTYTFLYELLDEVADIFPYKYIHLGGDEACKTKWLECPDCRKAVIDNKLGNMESLQGFFTQKMIDHLKTRGRTVIVWNEALDSGKLDKSAVVQYWQDGPKQKHVLPAVNSGRQIIVSKFTPLYLDYPYGMHPLRAVYNFEPEFKGVEPSATKNILGVESPQWTEYIPTPENLEIKTFPRLIATAELGWTKRENKNLADFKARLPEFFKILDLYNVKYTSVKDSDVGRLKGLPAFIKFFKEVKRGVPVSEYREIMAAKKRAMEPIE